MNPYYPDKGFTVISIDVSKKDFPHTKRTTKKKSTTHNKELVNLVKKHEKMSRKVLQTPNANIQYKRINGVLYSADNSLHCLEKKIRKTIHYLINSSTTSKLENNIPSFPELYACRWADKNNTTINYLLKLLQSGTEEEINIILLQLIPLVNKLSSTQKNRLFEILTSEILISPSSILRNKTLSILSLMPIHIKMLKPEHIKLIQVVAKTKQLNSNFPAKQILNELK